MSGYGGDAAVGGGPVGAQDQVVVEAPPPPNRFSKFPKPNYINPETRAPLVIGFNVSFVLLALIVVLLRIWSRRVIVGFLSADDWLIIVGWICSFALSFWLCYATKFGMGRHIWDIPFEWFPGSILSGYVFTALYNPTLTIIKCSILVIYLRLSPSKQFRMYCMTTLAVVIASGLSISLVLFFPCRPVHASWSFVPGSKCVDQNSVYLAGGIINTITDAVILFLPMPILLKVRLPKKEKIALNAMFALGIFVTTTSLTRLILVVRANNTDDFIYEGALVAMVSGIEVNVAIICASLPAIRPFIKRMFPKLLSPSAAGKSDKSYNESITPLKPASRSTSPSSSLSYLAEKPLPEPPKLPILKHLRSSAHSAKGFGMNSYVFSGDFPPVPAHLAFVKTRGLPVRTLHANDFPFPPFPVALDSPDSMAHSYYGPGIAKKVEFKVDTRTRSQFEGDFHAWQNRTV